MSNNSPVEGVDSCALELTDHWLEICINRRLRKTKRELSQCFYSFRRELLGTGKFEFSESKNNGSKIQKTRTILKKPPSLNCSDDEIEEVKTSLTSEAFKKETRAIKIKIILSSPRRLEERNFHRCTHNNLFMSIVPRGYKTFSNLISLPELFNFKCVESQYAADRQFITIRELNKQKDCQSHEKIYAMNRYYSHFVMTFTLTKKFSG